MALLVNISHSFAEKFILELLLFEKSRYFAIFPHNNIRIVSMHVKAIFMHKFQSLLRVSYIFIVHFGQIIERAWIILREEERITNFLL